MSISKQIVYLGDFYEEAEKLRKSFGVTDKFSTGDTGLDSYMGSGFGREDGYEVMLLYGPTGIGKSLVGLNFLKDAMIKNRKVGLMVLEDDMADVSVRLGFILGDDYKRVNEQTNVVCMPQEALLKSWKLDDLLELIEDWYTKLGVELIFLDHLQFAFEGAEAIKGENEYAAQRVFMQKLNQMMKRVKKTLILVSHVNKASGMKGMDKVMGSGAIAQAATKVIEVKRKDGDVELWMRKSRFTRTPEYPHVMRFKGTVLEAAT